MADGRIISHVPYDILYVVPNFIDTFHIKRCGVEDKPVNTKELMARVTVALICLQFVFDVYILVVSAKGSLR